jgi:hypothetical protein
MNKYAMQIEREMDFLMSGNLKKTLSADDAIQHLSKACELLENAGLTRYSAVISSIIKKAQSIDESDIEVVV